MTLSSLFTHPLFSTTITLYILILLYFPTLFLRIIFSPVFISASILFLSLLRLGAMQKSNQITRNAVSAEKIETVSDDCKWVSSKPSGGSDSGPGSDDNHNRGKFHSNASFVEWDVRAPLEVIYEGYEGQGGESDDVLEEKGDAQMAILERYASLSKFYPETDSDTSEEEEDFPAIRGWDSPENMGFRWEGEDRDGMIEIALEGKGYSDVEEENLIEIDLYPAS